VSLLLCTVQSFAGFFIEQKYEDIPPRDTISSFSFGGELELVYFLSSLHPGISLGAEYRFHKHHSADFFVSALFSGKYLEVGLGWRFFFRGLREDDFLRLGFSMISFEREDKNYFPPRLTFGYGRDFMFFKNSGFLCRVELNANYIFGEPLAEKEGEFMYNETHFSAGLNIGFYFF